MDAHETCGRIYDAIMDLERKCTRHGKSTKSSLDHVKEEPPISLRQLDNFTCSTGRSQASRGKRGATRRTSPSLVDFMIVSFRRGGPPLKTS